MSHIVLIQAWIPAAKIKQLRTRGSQLGVHSGLLRRASQLRSTDRLSSLIRAGGPRHGRELTPACPRSPCAFLHTRAPCGHCTASALFSSLSVPVLPNSSGFPKTTADCTQECALALYFSAWNCEGKHGLWNQATLGPFHSPSLQQLHDSGKWASLSVSSKTWVPSTDIKYAAEEAQR